jgi:phage-related baseplate assembly protein
MSSFDYSSYSGSPALYIDFSRLPPPKVIEEIDYEKLLAIYQGRVVNKLPTLERATKLEQSPTNVILQTEAYGEMMVRARVNAAARAIMLPFATGSDLDVLAAFYDEARPALVDTPRGTVDEYPEDWLDDASFRRIVQLSPESFSTAGAEGAYIYHCLKADPANILDASASRVDLRGGVRCALMGRNANPAVTPETIAKVRERLNRKNIKPLTDTPYVVGAKVVPVEIDALVTLFDGPDAALVKADIVAAFQNLRQRVALLGRDLTRAAIDRALMQEGAQNARIKSPLTDTVVGNDACVWITKATVNFETFRAS